MTCERVLPLLSAYFDRELGVTESVEVEGHVGECDRCSAALRRHEALHSSLTSPALVFTPPIGLEWRVRQALRRETRRSASLRPPWRWASVPVAAALAAALSWTVAVHRDGTSPENVVASELVSGHVRSLMANHLVDVRTSDQHTVKPWFNGKVDFAPPVVDFTASGFPLVGGRVDYIARRPVAVIVYKRHEHVVNVFVWPSGSDDGQGLRDLTFEGYHLLRWTRSGLTFWAVSDVNGADLKTLAGLFQDSG